MTVLSIQTHWAPRSLWTYFSQKGCILQQLWFRNRRYTPLQMAISASRTELFCLLISLHLLGIGKIRVLEFHIVAILGLLAVINWHNHWGLSIRPFLWINFIGRVISTSMGWEWQTPKIGLWEFTMEHECAWANIIMTVWCYSSVMWDRAMEEVEGWRPNSRRK